MGCGNSRDIQTKSAIAQRNDLSTVPTDQITSNSKIDMIDYSVDSGPETEEIKEGQKPNVHFLSGGPGSGKKNALQELRQRQPTHSHISVSDVLEQEIKAWSKAGAKIQECIKKGELVPSKIVCKLLKKQMKREGWHKKEHFIEGFPRCIENIEEWNKCMGDKTKIKQAIFIEPNAEEQKKVIEGRGKEGDEVSNQESEVANKRIKHYEIEMPKVVDVMQKQTKVEQVKSVQGINGLMNTGKH